MSGLQRKAHTFLLLLGIDAGKTFRTLCGLPGYFRDLRELKRQMLQSSSHFVLGKYYPCFDDSSAESGIAKGQYFHQDLLVARRIFTDKPRRHIDVGSRIDGFIAHLAVFREVEIFDIRPLASDMSNIKFVRADLMGELDSSLIDCCESLSCLHAIEHFGLGRYGDSIKFDGHLVGLNNMYRILMPGGKFYLSAPIGPQRIEFNGHRVFSTRYLLDLFKDAYDINWFSFIDDAGNLHENVSLTPQRIDANFDCNFGLGIFEMTKIAKPNDEIARL